LLATVRATFGEDHPETVTVGYFEASFRAKRGTADDIRQALADLAALLPRAERVLGPHSLWPGEIRTELAELPKRLAELERP
jgi:hypothetical protein